MTNWFDKRIALLGAIIAAALSAPALAAWPPPSYKAIYDIYADGKKSSETRVTFTRDGDNWSLSSTTEGVKGLARFLRVTSNDAASGSWFDRSAKPARFSHRAKVAIRKDAWDAIYDWDAGTVTTHHEEGESVLEIKPGTADPASLTLELQARLNDGMTKWDLLMVDEDEIDQHRYSAETPVPLQTEIGCIEAVEVKRIRENSKRYTNFWAASELHFIPVRMVHGKTDGHELDSRLRELFIEGEPVAVRADCP